MRWWKTRIIKGQWRHMTRKWFFKILTPKNHHRAFKNHRNVFCSSRGTRWTLKFRSSSIRSKVVIGVHGFSSLDLTSEVTGWPRTLSLYTNLFVSRRATRLVFFREALAQSGAKRHGGRTPGPLCRGRMRNGLCRRGCEQNRAHCVREPQAIKPHRGFSLCHFYGRTFEVQWSG